MAQLQLTAQERQSRDKKQSDANSLIQSLLQLAVPNAAANTMKQAESMNESISKQKSSASPTGTESTNNMSGTILLKEVLDKFKAIQGVDAFAQGVPYNKVLEQSLNEELTFNTYQDAILKRLLNKQPQMSVAPQMSMAPQPMQQPSVDQPIQQPVVGQPMQQGVPQQNAPLKEAQGGQFAQEAMALTQQPKGILQGFLTGFSQGTGYTGTRLENLAKAQKIAGQEPLQAGEKEKAGLDLIKTIQMESLKQAAELQKQNRLTPEQLFTKFEAASQPFIAQRDAFSRLNTFSDKIDSATAVDDVSILYQYIKLLDPTSTVRESEIATVENAKGVGDKVINAYNNAIKGNKLSANQRRDIFNQANKVFKSAEDNALKTTKEFAKLGKQSGIDPKVFIRDTGLASSSEDDGFKTTPSGLRYKVVQ